jgi:GxxExxY protein
MREKKAESVDFSDLNPVTEKIIGCAFTVSNTLGAGFLEKVYENALALEIKKTGLKVLQQYPIQVWYDGVVVGEFFADLLVQDSVVVEIKAVKAFDEAHWAQCLNYLKATGLRMCLLLNFGKPRLEIKRIVLSAQGRNLPQINADKHR